jgi:galactokinase
MKQGELIASLTEQHGNLHNASPEIIAWAPGRIEILGNHLDYNGGMVLSAAIDSGIGLALSPLNTPELKLQALDLQEQCAVELPASKRTEAPPWASYIIGVLNGLTTPHQAPHGFCATIAGNLPLGAGLSSSAALEAAVALAISHYYGLPADRMHLAQVCREAEQAYAGVNCGLLDQLSVLFGKAGQLTLIDFANIEWSHCVLPAGGRFVLCNPGLPHVLADSAYNRRREECQTALSILAAKAKSPLAHLAHASKDLLKTCRTDMADNVYRRARHVIEEQTRVKRVQKSLAAGHLNALGKAMNESHQSSRDLFENSTPEQDLIVETAQHTKGVLGARLTGGGFGGQVLLLVQTKGFDDTTITLQQRLEKTLNHSVRLQSVTVSNGACLLTGNRHPDE